MVDFSFVDLFFGEGRGGEGRVGGGGVQENWHLFILNGHGLHVTIEALK
jgi:hypothetical protein